MSALPRLARLFRILTLLATRTYTRRQLAHALGISERRLQQDLAMLAQAGIAIERLEHGGYRLRTLPPPGVPNWIAPGYAVSVQGSTLRLVYLQPRGLVSWVEEAVDPQPPLELLRAAVDDPCPPRALFPLTEELRAWLRAQRIMHVPQARRKRR